MSLPQLQGFLSISEWAKLNSAVSEAQRQSQQIRAQDVSISNGDSTVEKTVERIARQVRNETLNLMCPHCRTPYAEFDGCMAILCESCRKWFCGYCHDPFPDSSTSHQHVLVCGMNENGTHHANAQELQRGQKKYRTKKLKEVLGKQGHDIQHATILELQRELADLGISQEAILQG
ncbi:expressed unknown protein [Seminavis robusta]|uniref:Uncharacterized protein n=1 Tax=Seminavis robusta TaxID=568900 RepID=A0A9N8F0R0_9STRA|nr:expressed unknown protein [Seminavis robusta]|eukprot:Sro2398_g326100.1 n/a (176) ;mRNA; r:3396-3923